MNKIKSGLSAKSSSLVAQIIGAVWIAVWSGIKFVSDFSSISVADVALSGVMIASCFAPVYFSILIDKIRGVAAPMLQTPTESDGGGK